MLEAQYYSFQNNQTPNVLETHQESLINFEDERNLRKRFEYDEDGDIIVYGRLNLAKAHSTEEAETIVYAPIFLRSELDLSQENPYLSQLQKHAQAFSITFPSTETNFGEFIYTTIVDHLDKEKWIPADYETLDRFVTAEEDDYISQIQSAKGPKHADSCCEILLRNGERDHWHGEWQGHNKGQLLMTLALAGSERAKAVLYKLIEEDETRYEGLDNKRLRDLPEDERLIRLSDIMILRKSKESQERVAFEVPKFINDTAKSVAILASGKAEKNQDLKEKLLRAVSNENTGWFRYDTKPSEDEKILNKNASEQFTSSLTQARKQWHIESSEQIQDALRLLLNTPFSKEQEAKFLNNLAELDKDHLSSLTSEQIAAILTVHMEISTRPNSEDLTEQEQHIITLAALLQEQGHFFVNWRDIKEGMIHPKGAHGAIGAGGAMAGCCSAAAAAGAASSAASAGGAAMGGSSGGASGGSSGGGGGGIPWNIEIPASVPSRKPPYTIESASQSSHNTRKISSITNKEHIKPHVVAHTPPMVRSQRAIFTSRSEAITNLRVPERKKEAIQTQTVALSSPEYSISPVEHKTYKSPKPHEIFPAQQSNTVFPTALQTNKSHSKNERIIELEKNISHAPEIRRVTQQNSEPHRLVFNKNTIMNHSDTVIYASMPASPLSIQSPFPSHHFPSSFFKKINHAPTSSIQPEKRLFRAESSFSNKNSIQPSPDRVVTQSQTGENTTKKTLPTPSISIGDTLTKAFEQIEQRSQKQQEKITSLLHNKEENSTKTVHKGAFEKLLEVKRSEEHFDEIEQTIPVNHEISSKISISNLSKRKTTSNGTEIARITEIETPHGKAGGETTSSSANISHQAKSHNTSDNKIASEKGTDERNENEQTTQIQSAQKQTTTAQAPVPTKVKQPNHITATALSLSVNHEYLDFTDPNGIKYAFQNAWAQI